MDFDRYVWLVALIRYFDADAEPRQAMTAVLKAAGVTTQQFQEALAKYELPMVDAALRGVPDGPIRLADGLKKARNAILEARPSLEDLAPPPAAPEVDETQMVRLAIPSAAMPFTEAPPIVPPTATREPAPTDASEETVSMPLAAARSAAALPFQAPASPEVEETLIQPAPKPRSDR